MFPEICRDLTFLGATRAYDEARVVLTGAGLDATGSFRPGTREGPRSVRYYSQCIEEYSVRLGRDLRETPFCDLGDVDLTCGRTDEILSRIGAVAAKIISDGKIPFFIGGEHLITFPIIQEVCRKYPEVAVLHLDAHADLRDEYLGERYSHATVMRRVTEILGPGRVFQFGIRSADRAEVLFARNNTRLNFYKVSEPLVELCEEIRRPVYVTLDIDVVDPAYAPGVGTPEAGGISPHELMEAVYRFAGLNVVGFDVVEVNPVCDPGGLSSLLAATVIREMVLVVA